MAKVLETWGSYAGAGVSEYAGQEAARRAGAFAQGWRATADSARRPVMLGVELEQDCHCG
jgi:hypothetical protein